MATVAFDSAVYEGELVDGTPNGKGKCIFANGNVAEGNFANGTLCGKGKITLADGTVWEGDFIDYKLNGKGKIINKDGSVMEGNFVDGNMTGELVCKSADNNENSQQDSYKLDDVAVEPVDPDDYDVIANQLGEITIVMQERKGSPLSPQAFRTENQDIFLKRNEDDFILFDSLAPETFEYFIKVSKITVNEIDADDKTVHLYDVPLSDQEQ
jgi:hypothetical protein